jgi:putative lipoprotein
MKTFFLALVALVAVAAGLASCAEQGDGEQAAAMKTLSGTVTYRERMMLRPDAFITVRLQDVSRQDAPALLIAEDNIKVQGKAVPIAFALEYDPARIDERYTYSVRAEIRDGMGQLLFTTDTMHPVLTHGAPDDNVEIVVVAVRR